MTSGKLLNAPVSLFPNLKIEDGNKIYLRGLLGGLKQLEHTYPTHSLTDIGSATEEMQHMRRKNEQDSVVEGMLGTSRGTYRVWGGGGGATR